MFFALLPFTECKWNFTQPSGTFSSPYFPNNYHNFQDCQWNITVPKGHVIQLRFDVFELESNPHTCGNGPCICDYVEVKEESVTGDVTTLGRYCMTIVPLPIIQSSTNKMIVTFYSDHAISAKGFNASYTSILPFKGEISLTCDVSFSAFRNDHDYPANSWFLLRGRTLVSSVAFDVGEIRYLQGRLLFMFPIVLHFLYFV